MNLTFKDDFYRVQNDTGQIRIHNLSLKCSVDPMKVPLLFSVMNWSEDENVFRMDKSIDMKGDSNTMTLKISGNFDFEECFKNGKSEVTLCHNDSGCQVIETANRFEKDEDFWIKNLTKVRTEICCWNVTCKNEIGSVLVGKATTDEEQIVPEPITEMVNEKTSGSFCYNINFIPYNDGKML